MLLPAVVKTLIIIIKKTIVIRIYICIHIVKVYLSGGPVSLKIVGFNLEVAEGGGVGGDASSSSSSSVPSASSSSFATGAQPLSLGLIGPSSSTQSPSSPWRSVPGAEPSTPSSPETNRGMNKLVAVMHYARLYMRKNNFNKKVYPIKTCHILKK